MQSRTAPPESLSTSDVAFRPGWLRRLYDKITGKVAVKHPWYLLPEELGLAELIGIRDTLRRENLLDTSRLPSVDPVQSPSYDESYLTARTADGSWNDLAHPEMGMASTRFGRNVPLDCTWPDKDRMMVPNPREISLKLMTRDTFNPATAGNALIAAWLQFIIHDWFKHGTSPKENPWVMPQLEGDDWPAPPSSSCAHRLTRPLPWTRRCRRRTSTSTRTGGTDHRSTATTSSSSGLCAKALAGGCDWSTGCRRSRPTPRAIRP